MLQIEPNPKQYRYALDHLGFRPFFLLGSVFSVISISLWVWIYGFGWQIPVSGFGPVNWHAHEMIYGYSLAVIAGFLLTAVNNWTGVQTLHGKPLLVLVLLWLVARLMPFVPHQMATLVMATLDIVFLVWLSWEIFKPLHQAKKWEHLGVWVKLLFMLLGQCFFYLGLFGLLEYGMQWGLYTGLYIIISMVLLMGRRVIPFFVEKGVDGPVELQNYRWVDLSSLLLMLLFWVFAVFVDNKQPFAIVGMALFALHVLRMWGWHTLGIWSKPLLWVLYLAYGWVVLGFLFSALGTIGWISPMLAVHAFAYGGIGMITLGMMARVAYGHTGRNVFDPPKELRFIFALLFVGSVVRVLLPMVWQSHYLNLILISQSLWIVAFMLFLLIYAPLLVKPRVDGRYG